MTIASMTGFSRAEGHDDKFSWAWELRSVNGKGLDIRLRMPSGWERLDPQIRGAVQKRFKRGSVTLNLDIRSTTEQGSLRVNRDFLTELSDICKEMGETPQIDRLMAVRGVIEQAEDRADAAGDDDRAKAILETLNTALGALATARSEEGARIDAILADRLTEIEGLVEDAEKCAAAQPAAIQARLQQQISDLLGGSAPVAEDRLAQEVAVLVTKADVREELDRLQAHVAAARDILKAEGAVGRKLDFLCQEFNREANTLCSKSPDIDLTNIGLALKTTIDQLREQVANIE